MIKCLTKCCHSFLPCIHLLLNFSVFAVVATSRDICQHAKRTWHMQAQSFRCWLHHSKSRLYQSYLIPFPQEKNQGKTGVEAAAQETYKETSFDPHHQLGNTSAIYKSSMIIPWLPRSTHALCHHTMDQVMPLLVE